MEINHAAVWVAAVAAFLLGAIWYLPLLFSNALMKANQSTEESLKETNIAFVLGTAFFLMVMMAYNLAFFLGNELSLGASVGYGVAAGLGWATFSLAILYIFEYRPFAYVAIHSGFKTLSFVCMGLILGVWR
jgi:hypothetical protein